MLKDDIERLAAAGAAADRDAAREGFGRGRAALSSGELRSAEPDAASYGGWRVNAWVKQGILLGFKFGDVVDMSPRLAAYPPHWQFFDKDTLPLRHFEAGGPRRPRAR